MKYRVTIDDVSSIYEIENAWTHDDYVNLLELIEFGDTGDATDQDLRELLFLALSEYEPQEAAELVLRYRFKDEFNDGQYEQISNDMLKENVAEKHSDITLHSKLFDVNEFLYKAYNGKFPHGKASVIQFTATPIQQEAKDLDESDSIRLLSAGIDPHAILQRLYKDQISGKEDFPEAAHIIWYFKKTGDYSYQLTTSDYWINNDDFIKGEFEAVLIEEQG